MHVRAIRTSALHYKFQMDQRSSGDPLGKKKIEVSTLLLYVANIVLHKGLFFFN